MPMHHRSTLQEARAACRGGIYLSEGSESLIDVQDRDRLCDGSFLARAQHPSLLELFLALCAQWGKL